MSVTDHAKPPYQRIADDLRAKIENESWPVGTQLPSIRVLAESYSAGTMTIQRAIGVLRDSGLIATTQGHGTFVRGTDGGRDAVEVTAAEHIARMEADIERLTDSLVALKRHPRSS
jgi:DNA-binding GntR family transcriptional regulator